MEMIEKLAKMMEVYGSAVRAGAITPQPDDEAFIRDALDLPPMQQSTSDYWNSISNVRRPITLAEGKGEPPAMESPDEEPSENQQF